MLEPNLPNFITVAIISILAAVAVRTIAKAMGKDAPV